MIKDKIMNIIDYIWLAVIIIFCFTAIFFDKFHQKKHKIKNLNGCHGIQYQAPIDLIIAASEKDLLNIPHYILHEGQRARIQGQKFFRVWSKGSRQWIIKN